MNIKEMFRFAVNETITIKDYIFVKSPVNNHLQNIFFVKPGQEMRSFGYCMPAAEGTDDYILLNKSHIWELVNHGVFTKEDLMQVKNACDYIGAHCTAAFEKFAVYCDGKDFCLNVKESEYERYAKEAFIDNKTAISDYFLVPEEERISDLIAGILQKDHFCHNDEFTNECFLGLIADSNVDDFDDFIKHIEHNFAYQLADKAQAMMHAIRLVESYNQRPALCFRRNIYQMAVNHDSDRLIVFADTAYGHVICVPENIERSFVFDEEEQCENIWFGCSYRNENGKLSDVRLDEITEIRTEYGEVIFRKGQN